jgi:hypothetical protein
MPKSFRGTVCLLIVVFAGSSAPAASITGNPATDGWVSFGNSLQNGVYVDGVANYGFNTYSAGLAVQAGSILDISDGSNSWLAGDTVLGVGGVFQSITAAQAGWSAFSGGAVNSLLPSGQNPSALKLQAKFGTSLATWSTSTIAPGPGNGNGSSGNGGGRVQVRTSGWFGATEVTDGQTEPWTWAGNSGQLLVLDKDSHIEWDGGSPPPSKYAARMIWHYDASSGHVDSWELLLDVSLLNRLAPGHLLPSIGNNAILTVQNADGAHTNALVTVVPEPGAAALLITAGLGVLYYVRRHRSWLSC